MMLGISALVLLSALSSSPLDEGIALFKAGQYTAAAAKFKAAHADGYLALTQAASGHCEEALPALAKVNGSGELPKLAGIATARCYTTLGKTREAVTTAEALKAQFPRDADVLYVTAEAEMRAFNDSTLLMFQNTPGSYRVHELSARIFETQDRFADAVNEYKKAIEVAPDAPDLHFRLGRALLLASHDAAALASAKSAFEDELRISPEDSACQFQLGQIAQVQGNTADAKQHFESAIRLAPQFVAAMVGLANVYSHERDFQRAIPLLQNAVALQPQNESAHYALLTAYRNAGDRPNAAREKNILDKLQKPASGEFSEFLKKLGETPSKP